MESFVHFFASTKEESVISSPATSKETSENSIDTKESSYEDLLNENSALRELLEYMRNQHRALQQKLEIAEVSASSSTQTTLSEESMMSPTYFDARSRSHSYEDYGEDLKTGGSGSTLMDMSEVFATENHRLTTDLAVRKKILEKMKKEVLDLREELKTYKQHISSQSEVGTKIEQQLQEKRKEINDLNSKLLKQLPLKLEVESEKQKRSKVQEQLNHTLNDLQLLKHKSNSGQEKLKIAHKDIENLKDDLEKARQGHSILLGDKDEEINKLITQAAVQSKNMEIVEKKVKFEQNLNTKLKEQARLSKIDMDNLQRQNEEMKKDLQRLLANNTKKRKTTGVVTRGTTMFTFPHYDGISLTQSSYNKPPDKGVKLNSVDDDGVLSSPSFLACFFPVL